ncbi:DUF2283 domain-containing protein [Candidatus Pacearchaeota archaeon]|nr:DUF2283 domain-containing protein [Candidatus Pacearchaeota archaeon]
MKYKYDPETDVLVITLGVETPDFGEQRENIITHYTKDGLPIEIEILDASHTAVKILEAITRTKKVGK